MLGVPGTVPVCIPCSIFRSRFLTPAVIDADSCMKLAVILVLVAAIFIASIMSNADQKAASSIISNIRSVSEIVSSVQ